MHYTSPPELYAETLPIYILLKAEKRSLKSIAKEVSSSVLTVNRWVNRYLKSGMDGLWNKPGQGVKLIMESSDTEKVIEAIQKDRLSVMKAKERWQETTDKETCKSMFRSFSISPGARFGRIRKVQRELPRRNSISISWGIQYY